MTPETYWVEFLEILFIEIYISLKYGSADIQLGVLFKLIRASNWLNWMSQNY